MTIAMDFPPGDPEFDVCIIGAGPAGLAVALQCEARGLSTLVIEAGGRKPRKGGTALNEADILNEQHHEPLHVTTRQSFGGTSWAWGGHCVPFDTIDFEKRAYVPESGWPIGAAEVRKWEDAAAAYLKCGEPVFRAKAAGWQDLRGIDVDSNDRKSTTPNLARAYRDQIEGSRNIWLCVEKAVIGLELNATGEHVIGFRTHGGSMSRPLARARTYVLAGGGLQTTRLLLELQCEWPRHFGGEGGPLGRYYMGHIAGEIATIVFNAEEDANEFLLKFDGQGIPTLRRFWVDEDLQRSEHILNTAFMLRTPPLADYRHGSGALSLMVLGLSPAAFRDGMRSRLLRGTLPNQAWLSPRHHIINVLRDPVLTAAGLKQILHHRFFLETHVPLIVRNKSGRYALRYHAEQVPNPESRVRLGDCVGPFGTPPLSIDFRFTEQDARSVLRAHEVLDDALQASGKGRLEYWHPAEERMSAVLAQATDGYHQVGTTRMRLSPREGVVDSDCRVHGIRNLFVASSSVFPTTGQANPTFTIAALALRLANHLADLSSRQQRTSNPVVSVADRKEQGPAAGRPHETRVKSLHPAHHHPVSCDTAGPGPL